MLRYVTASVLGAIATIGLLTLMQALIADPKPAEAAPYQGHLVEWVRLLEDPRTRHQRSGRQTDSEAGRAASQNPRQRRS